MEHIELHSEDGGIQVVRLARPPVNALCAALLGEVRDALAAMPDTVKAVVVWGGDSVFAAGADVEEFVPVSPEGARSVTAAFRDALDTLAAFPRPTVAAVTGYALGGGLELALACDFRVAGDNARLGFPEIQLGIIPGGGGTQRAARLIGPARTKDLVYSGRHIRAAEAAEIGLVDRVVSPDEVYESALAWAGKLATGAVAAMGLAKDAIDTGLGLPLAAGLDLEAERFAATFATRDARHGIDSFLENGPGKAEFQGN